MNNKKKNLPLLLFILFYLIGSLLTLLPFVFFSKFKLIKQLSLIFKFNLNILCVIISVITLFFFLFLSYIDDKDTFKKNLFIVEKIFGNNPSVYTILVLSFIAGFFEEILFKGYFYYFFILFLKIKYFNFINVLLIVIISLLFGLFHISQGIKGFIVSITISIILFITFIISKSIWYPVITHAVYNFTVIMLIIPTLKIKHKI